MARKTREALKGQFQNGSIPTAQHFGDLIDSALNKRDDQFYGNWQPGVAHRLNDVVVYCESIYVLYKTDGTKPDDTYCSPTKPNEDKTHWRQLQFELQDKDWVIPAGDSETYIYAHSTRAKRVGIGHLSLPDQSALSPADQPQAQLHIYGQDRGEFLFNPEATQGGKDPGAAPTAELQMRAFNYKNAQQEPCLTLRLDDNWLNATVNTAKGFRFGYIDPSIQTILPQVPTTLMVVSAENLKPEVGIGTETPEATLHIKDPGVGEAHINPSTGGFPEIRLTNLKDDQNNACLSFTVDADFADFSTNAEKGFRFQPKTPSNNDVKSAKGTVVSITPHGQVGVGIETPDVKARLHVTDQDSGTFKVYFDGYRPAVAITQHENGADKGSFVLGMDAPVAVLSTDAACGFVFRHTETGKDPKEIHQGADQVWIDAQGQLGVGQEPELHELDVKGAVRQYENYMASTADKIALQGTINGVEALEIVNCLNPIVFKWESGFGNISTKNEHYGLNQDECKKFVPTIVKKDDKDAVVGLNYIELIPVLIAAVKEQQKIINTLLQK
jgi:hypothetical protein